MAASRSACLVRLAAGAFASLVALGAPRPWRVLSQPEPEQRQRERPAGLGLWTC